MNRDLLNGIVADVSIQLSQYAQLMRLDKPIGIWLLLWPTLWGLWISAAGHPDSRVFAAFVAGVIVMRSAGCVFNDFADRKLDPLVARTKLRPLAAGTTTPIEALMLCIALLMIALGIVLTLNRLTQMLAVGGVILTLVYPFAKRFFAAPQFILGAAFGWAIPMAFAAQTGAVPKLGWLMWLAVVIWAVIYDTMYAMADRQDDLKAGIKSTAILFGQADVFIICMLQLVLLFALQLIGQQAELGSTYTLALLAVIGLMVYQFFLIRERDPKNCFAAFLNNRHIGSIVFVGIMLDYALA
ncbi:MAG: 4-hydroxybenzoate octaprenyltransferase [Gammaproteobacteria bacterium]|nr:4-hydroxybenzoate octaprenyltransferase [Gammaproteobacteria bacterium]